MKRLTGLLLLLLLGAITAQADEGMWTYHDFPAAALKQKHGVTIDQKWLDRVRTSTVRLGGCSASFISPDGLILTNHHCVASCLAENSSKEKSLLEDGFMAGSREKELRCKTQIADVLMDMENITPKVEAAIKGLDNQAASDKRKKTLTELEQACEKSSGLKCETVNLYNGGQYWLYKYKRYSDVRLAFAPEAGIAAFGGDPDNFQFPRWCLDMGLLRAYDKDGKPAKPMNHLQIDFNGPDAGELVFVSGHPGSTSRLLTVSQLLTLRDIDLPQWLLRASELRGRYIQFAKSSPEAGRIVEAPLNSLENGIKVRRKLLDALHNDAMLAQKKQEEGKLLAALKNDNSGSGNPFAEIEKTQQAKRALSLPYTFIESGAGFQSKIFGYARTLVRGAAERPKTNTDRLPEFRDAALPRAEQNLSAQVPVYPELEKITLAFGLERMREWLGPDHPVVRKLLAKDSPDTLAKRLVDESKLADPKVRMELWKGGAAAVDASDDPMIELVKAIDDEARAIRKRYEDEVEATLDAASEAIARQRFKTYGTTIAPDATFTLRLNYGTVQGWMENGQPVEPFTRLSRLFERATGQEPFKIPDSWLRVKDTLDMDTRFNLSTNNDIVGGNSGSALIDANANVVGLIFDGNIHSISGSYSFDTEKNRSVAVNTQIIKEALTKVYKADALFREMSGSQPKRK